jgi:FtsH-binding integral membrane protein
VSGGLYYQPHPSVVWFWPVAVILLCVLAAWRLRSNALDRRLVTLLTQALLIALIVVAVARLLHGRPFVSPAQIAEFLVAVAAILAGAVAFARGRFPAAIPLIVAFVALWAGLTFLPILTHQDAQLILPGWLNRATTALLLGGGLSLVAMGMRRPLIR